MSIAQLRLKKTLKVFQCFLSAKTFWGKLLGPHQNAFFLGGGAWADAWQLGAGSFGPANLRFDCSKSFACNGTTPPLDFNLCLPVVWFCVAVHVCLPVCVRMPCCTP
jgi:hypothetical protein